jgi:hypothetical protein
VDAVGIFSAAIGLLALLFQAGEVLRLWTITIFRYVAQRRTTRRNVCDESTVEKTGVGDLSSVFPV